MTQMEYDKLDYYERLRTLIVVAAETKRGLESIVSKYDAWDYIMRLLDNLESYLPLFSQDIEFNSIELLIREFKDMKEIIPLIREDKADYSYLIMMLTSVEDKAESMFPDNVRLARFLDSLISHKDKFTSSCDIEMSTFLSVMNKMKDNCDIVNSIINNTESKKK